MAGFFSRLAKGIKGATIDPITKMYAGGNQLARSFIDPLVFNRAYKPKLSGLTRAILDEEDERRLLQDPAAEGLKGTAGTAGLALAAAAAPVIAAAPTLPAALGLGGGFGAVGGGLSGLSQTDDIQDLEAVFGDVLEGGVRGGAFGAGGAGLGYGLQQVLPAAGITDDVAGSMADDVAGSMADDVAASSLDDIGSLSRIQRKGLEMQAKGSGIWDDALSQSDNIKNFIKARRANVTGVVPRQTLERASQAEKAFLNQKSLGLGEIATQTDDDLVTILANADDLLSKGGQARSTLGSKAWQNVQDSIVNTAGDPGLLDDLAMRYQDLAYTSRGAKKTIAAEVYDRAAKSIRDHLKAQSPTYRAAEEGLSSIYQTMSKTPLKKSASRVARQGVGSPLVTGDKIPIPTRTMGRSVQSGIGGLLERGVNLPPGVSEAAMRAAPMAAPALQGAGQAAGLLGPQMGGSSYPESGGAAALESMGLAGEQQPQRLTSADIRAALSAPAEQREAQRAQALNSLIEMGMKTSEAKTIVDVNYPKIKAPTLSDTQSKALGVYDLISGLEGAMQQGGVAGSYFLPVSTEAKNVRSSRRALAEAIGRMQSGGAISKEEERRFTQMIPGITDDPESAAYKLDLLREMVMNLVAGEQEVDFGGGDIIDDLAGF